MAYLSARLYSYGFGFSLIFFAGYCLVMGYLIFRSGYLPRALGVLLQIAGLCYLMNSFALLLAPASRIGFSPRSLRQHSSASYLSLCG